MLTLLLHTKIVLCLLDNNQDFNERENMITAEQALSVVFKTNTRFGPIGAGGPSFGRPILKEVDGVWIVPIFHTCLEEEITIREFEVNCESGCITRMPRLSEMSEKMRSFFSRKVEIPEEQALQLAREALPESFRTKLWSGDRLISGTYRFRIDDKRELNRHVWDVSFCTADDGYYYAADIIVDAMSGGIWSAPTEEEIKKRIAKKEQFRFRAD